MTDQKKRGILPALRDENRYIRPQGVIARIAVGAVALFAFFFIIAGMTNVGATERDVVFHSDGTLSILPPGKFQWVTPIFNDVTTYDVRDKTYTESAVGLSSDAQETTTEITVLYHPDESAIQTIHQTLGRGYEKKVVVPAVQGCVKDVVSDHPIENLTGAPRSVVVQGIVDCIHADLASRHLVATKVTVTDFDFSKLFNEAIEAKAVAQQKAQEEKNRLEQTGYKAQQTIVEATAQRDAAILISQATQGEQGEAYLFMQWLEAWRAGGSQVPQVMSGDGGLPFLMPLPQR